jgi:uncharacterized protein (DUF302 family)
MPAEGLIAIASRFGAKETLDRVKAELRSRALELFAEIDHAQNATNVGLSLRPSVVLVFGNAKAGTPLMQANQAVGLDLPLKALVWEDAAGKTWISYNDPVWIAGRYGLPAEAMQIAEKMRQGLDALIKSAAAS